MNVLMLGNGFDLNYKLLTKYINFLNIVNHIATARLLMAGSVGDILGDPKLHLADEDVARSYQVLQTAYDNVPLDLGVLTKLEKLADENLLFSYLSKSFNRDVGWIDFEKEISVIIHAFRDFLERGNLEFATDSPKYGTSVGLHIISHFNCFCDGSGIFKKVSAEYVREYPQGSSNKIIHKEKIIKELERQLLELAEGLRIYLRFFVENVVDQMCKLDSLLQIPALTDASHVVTFNYTSTYEHIYKSEKVYHIHGSTRDRIILGVNPDETDELNSIETSFLRFKKYYQRVIYHSDDEYLKWIKHTKDFALVVMGHSLDVTDKDIIMQLFGAAKDITVLYHSESAETSLVANLINIYGKQAFDELRTKKRLRFLPLNAEYSGFAEDRQEKEHAEELRALRSFRI